MADEKPGHTLQPTALVHEAYLRLIGGSEPQLWNARGHFFMAAAEAMRRILIENARRKNSQKRGGGLQRENLDEQAAATPEISDDVLALDEALTKLAGVDPKAAELVKLRHFAGLTIPQTAEVLCISPRSANDLWAYARPGSMAS